MINRHELQSDIAIDCPALACGLGKDFNFQDLCSTSHKLKSYSNWWNKKDNKDFPDFNLWWDPESTTVLSSISNYIISFQLGQLVLLTQYHSLLQIESIAVLHCVLAFLIHHDIFFNCIFILLKYKHDLKKSCIY